MDNPAEELGVEDHAQESRGEDYHVECDRVEDLGEDNREADLVEDSLVEDNREEDLGEDNRGEDLGEDILVEDMRPVPQRRLADRDMRPG
jgi:hypothetical protein